MTQLRFQVYVTYCERDDDWSTQNKGLTWLLIPLMIFKTRLATSRDFSSRSKNWRRKLASEMECLNNISIAHYYVSPILFSPLPLPPPPHPPKKSPDHKLRKGEWNALRTIATTKYLKYCKHKLYSHILITTYWQCINTPLAYFTAWVCKFIAVRLLIYPDKF